MKRNSNDKPTQKSFDFLKHGSHEGKSIEFDQESNPVNKTIDDSQLEEIYNSVLALSTLEGVGFKTICDAFDMNFLTAIWDIEGNLSEHPFIQKNNIPSLKQFSQNAKVLAETQSQTLKNELEKSNITFTAIGHSTYPSKLYNLEEPPRWLFVQGDCDTLHSGYIIAIIGTRDATEQGVKLAKDVASNLAKHNLIVLSGMATGIDEAAHWGCIDYYGQTIAVLGQGIRFNRLSKSISYLRDSILIRGGTIISEYLPNDPPSRRTFLRRNSIQTTLSQAIIPIEFPKRQSGTGSTILNAKKMGIPLFGILPKSTSERSLQSTKQNFAEEKIEVYEFDKEIEETIVDVLSKLLKNHNWFPGPKERQSRFFSILVDRVMQAKERIDLDENAVDDFTKLLTKALKERSDK